MASRIVSEKRTVTAMVQLYCRRHHHNGELLCDDCQRLLDYAHLRLDRCRFGEQKGTCRKCPMHCYRPQMAVEMRRVMRWAGPRMLLYHPIMAVEHLLREYLITNRQ